MTKSKNSSKYAESVWMINKARDCITEGDPYSAKSWLLTAKSLFPGSFAIQDSKLDTLDLETVIYRKYEEFLIERRAGNVKRCGRLFYEMMMCFSKEQFLLEELARIFHSRDAHRSQNAETIFSKEMFASLPENQQKELLLKYANHQTNIIDKCQISLLVLKRFKSSVCDQATSRLLTKFLPRMFSFDSRSKLRINLIKTLKSTEDKESPNEPQNIYRKMIVFDVLPLILKNPDVQLASQTPKNKNTSFISERQLLYFLNLAMEFLVSYAMQKYTLIPMVKLSDAFVFENQEGTSCWSLLHDQFLLFATKLNWLNILKIKEKIDPSKNRPLKSRYKTLNHLKESKPEIGAFYAILQLYLYTVMEYSSSILSSVHTPTREGNSDNEYILLENIDHMTQKETTHQSVIRAPKKKRKTDDSGSHSSDYQSGSEDVTVIVHPSLIGQVNEALGECLQVAIETKHLLNTYFYDEFQQVSDDWKMSGWDWIRVFENDSLLYLGKPKQSIEFISSRQRNAAGNKLSLKEKLQLSSVHFCAGHKKVACEHALDALSYIPSSSFENSGRSDGKRVNKPDGRSLLLLSNNHNDILTYVVQVMFAALKVRLYTDDPNRDLIIGHLIVLCQMMWEVNEKFFLHLLKLIQAQDGGFSYEFFFTYIIHVDILEEFAFLHSMDSVVLCLTSNTENLSKKTVTRGVGRETQTDFKTSMRKQISRCNEPIRKVIYNFLLTERESILKDARLKYVIACMDPLKDSHSLYAITEFTRYVPFGKRCILYGQIIQPSLETPGTMQLKLRQVPYPTPYLVIKLGPLNPATYQYEYAVVTDTNKASLYIYARNVAKFQETYQKEVLKFCKDYGFNSYYNEPKKTPQPASCWYNRADANNTIPVELPLKAKEEDNFHRIAEALESVGDHRFCPRNVN